MAKVQVSRGIVTFVAFATGLSIALIAFAPDELLLSMRSSLGLLLGMPFGLSMRLALTPRTPRGSE